MRKTSSLTIVAGSQVGIFLPSKNEFEWKICYSRFVGAPTMQRTLGTVVSAQ